MIRSRCPMAARPLHLSRQEHGMNKFSDASSRLTAKMNRDRLTVPDRPAILEEEAKKGIAIRRNMARLRELRLAKEVRTEISTGNRSAKAKPK